MGVSNRKINQNLQDFVNEVFAMDTNDVIEEFGLTEIDDIDLSGNILLKMLDKAISLPGVKINRIAFLMDIYSLSPEDAQSDNVSDLLTLKLMDDAANKFIAANVTQSSAAAFFLGLPGGLAMAATIPADIMQNFAFTLRLAQQLAYIYGFENLFSEDNEMNEKTRNTLITFLGIMFAATGSGTVLRAIAPNIGKYAARQIVKAPLTKTAWYPMLKKITSVVASKTITKKGVTEFATKAIPVVGGVISAGVNVATMVPMANRLKNELRKYYLSEEELHLLEEKEKITFGDKASDAISDVAAGSAKAINNVKSFGKSFKNFAKQVSDKTKEKMDKQ